MPNQNTYVEIANHILRHDWDEESSTKLVSTEHEYLIEQFQGTAFPSDYACYKVSGWEWVPQGVIYHHHKDRLCLVVKQTNLLELLHLKRLNAEGFSVPYVACNMRYPKNPDKQHNVIFFETLLPGKELFLVDTMSAWLAATDAIVLIHKKYWNPESGFGEWWQDMDPEASQIAVDHFTDVFNTVITHSQNSKLWTKVTETIIERMKVAPKTLVHGDLFPTNFIVSDKQVGIIDWASAGEFPYFLDLGRFTGLLRADSAEPMCRFEDAVCKRYYEKLNAQLGISFEEFMRDIHMGQYIEVMRYYDPAIERFGLHPNKRHMITVNRLNELSAMILQG